MILVTGATGHLGGSIVRHLLKTTPAAQIVALVRDETKATHLKDAGIIVRIANYHQPVSLAAAFAGVDKAVLVSSNDFSDRLGQHKHVIDEAAAAGVKHLSYTGVSLKNVQASVLRSSMSDHFETEAYLEASGMHYTFMRHNLYAEMLPLYLGRQVLENGIVFPGGDGRVPFALRDEMGEANAHVLTSGGHENKIYNIANVVDYSFGEIADMLSELTGKTITYNQPDDASYLETLKAAGIPAHMAQVGLAFSIAMRNGDFEIPGNDLETLLGRKPAGLKSYLRQVYLSQ